MPFQQCVHVYAQMYIRTYFHKNILYVSHISLLWLLDGTI